MESICNYLAKPTSETFDIKKKLEISI